MPSLVFQTLGPFEIALIVLAILVVFGAGRLADIGGALGRSIREFRRELREGQEEEKKEEATKVEGKSEEEKKS
jgi:sec-independent protein translocase protein TatA